VNAPSLPFHGFFHRIDDSGEPRLVPHENRPASLPCPSTGRALKVATLDAHTPAVCPGCLQTGRGGFLSFVDDLRMAYACPRCEQLVWVAAV
jgi:hypothetical protein